VRFTTLLAVPAVALGLWLWLGYGIGWGPGNGWMHAKLFVVLLVMGYHHACGRAAAQASPPTATSTATSGFAGSTRRRC
jgi:uncharacterized membrane protein